jgi:2-polyprenyl-6-methoxyphenol hydroxylase-like FAD-dependent oxidoreductase
MNVQSPVLIVGAGPTGLMMACELARHGIPFTIIDKKSERIRSSNATWVQSRTLEILDQIGIVSRFVRAGHPCRAINLYISGKPSATIPLNHIDSPYPYILMLPQSDTERFLTERLRELKHEVERSQELVDIKVEDNNVISTIKMADGKAKTITSQWVIACDGANSIIRSKCQIVFSGDDLTEQFVVADAKIDSYMSTNEAHIFFDKGTVFAASPLGGSQFRIAANIHQNARRMVFYDKEVVDLVQERGHGAYYIKNVSWVSPFWAHGKYAEKLRLGPVFLVGDAAHIHSPSGGQGMNIGIQDAYNLAWKLALVIQGKAQSSLLDTYQAERHPIISEAVSQTEKFTKMALLDKSFLKKLRNFCQEINEDMVEKIGNMLAQVSIQYKNSPIINYHRLIEGTRAPDVMKLYHSFRNTQHNILLFTESADIIKKIQEWARKSYPDLIKIHAISKQPIENVDNNIVDAEGVIYKKYQVSDQALYIIRPDGYIGYIAEECKQSYIGDYMNKLFK